MSFYTFKPNLKNNDIKPQQKNAYAYAFREKNDNWWTYHIKTSFCKRYAAVYCLRNGNYYIHFVDNNIAQKRWKGLKYK